jgi:uncharacterized protein YecE (DUF72 family)
MAAVRVGCSGWSYRHWIGPFYPPDVPARQRFAHYAGHFDTVELNTTFYRLPTAAAVQGWADAAPPGFVYALKLGAFGSHRMKLRDAASWLPNHLDRAQRLGASLGPTVVQLPPRWRRDTARLDEFLHVAGATPLRWAVELREPSWVHDEVFTVLQRHRAALVLLDMPWECTTDWTYLRFHGPDAVARPYQGAYGRRRLERCARRLRPWVGEGRDLYAYFNNDDAAHAVRDACTLRGLLQDPDQERRDCAG